MNNIDNFKIRNCKGWVHHSNSYLKGKEAIVEYIRQKCSILKEELWWNYGYGLDYQNFNESYIISWIDDAISEIEFIKNIINIDVKKDENNQKMNVYIQVELVDNSLIDSNFNI